MAVVGCRSSMHTAGARYATHALISRGWFRGPGPSHEGLEVDAGWETRPSGIQTLPLYSGDLHLPQRLEGQRSPRDLHDWLAGAGIARIRVSQSGPS
jgi:hypothetical protein